MIIKRNNEIIYGIGGPYKRIFEHKSDRLCAIAFDSDKLENELAIILYLRDDEICGAVISDNWIMPVLDELIAGKYYLDLIDNKLYDKVGKIMNIFDQNFELEIIPKPEGNININFINEVN